MRISVLTWGVLLAGALACRAEPVPSGPCPDGGELVRDEDATGHRREWCQIRHANGDPNGEPEAHGRWTAWHHNGTKSVEGRMRHGRQVGHWTFWDERGRVIEVISYEDVPDDGDTGVAGD